MALSGWLGISLIRRTRRLGFNSATGGVTGAGLAAGVFTAADAASADGLAPVAGALGADLLAAGVAVLTVAVTLGVVLALAAGLLGVAFGAGFACADALGLVFGAATGLSWLGLLTLPKVLSVSSIAFKTAFSLRMTKRCSMMLPRSCANAA